MMPEMFVEISTGLADRLGIKNGQKVEVTTARGSICGKACVTERLQPLRVDGKVVEMIALPWHWGFVGLSCGCSTNLCTIDALDPNASMPEFKTALCNVKGVS